MPDKLVKFLIALYPEEFRQRFGPQIEADLFHPDTNKPVAIVDILWTAFVHRVKSPQPYIWGTAAFIAGCFLIFAIPAAVRQTLRAVYPRQDSPASLLVLLFSAVFLVVVGCLLVAINWHNTARKMAQCSKSRS